jgi:hypothetical protein
MGAGEPIGGKYFCVNKGWNPPPSPSFKRRNGELDPMEPLTPLETLCRIILRAKEYEAQVPTDYDGGEAPENVDDEGSGETLSVLDDSINTSVEEELIASLEDLAEDQQAELLAFAWVGQGTYEAADWDEAMEAAADENNVVEELMDMPMLASVLEAGLAAFDINCDGIGDLT